MDFIQKKFSLRFDNKPEFQSRIICFNPKFYTIMNVSQKLNHINESNYDDDITVTGIPPHYFIVVTGISYNEGNSTRDIRVDILPLEQLDRSTQTVNSGLFVRKEGETAVKATVYQDNNEMANNTQRYS